MIRTFSFIFATFFAVSLVCSAQNTVVRGDVSDGLTDRGLHKSTIKIYDAENGELLVTALALLQQVTEKGDNWSNTYYDDRSGATFAVKFAARPRLKVLVEATGYEAYEKIIDLDAREGQKKVELGSIYLMPITKEQHIGEATVTATKLKFFYKGDTLVYNADAFNLTQLESLRKLVEKLPGTEIKDGVIRVNGRTVDNLLISGKDFFNGDIQAALDNLPAYIVKSLKVYNKAGELTELTGRDMHDESYVMDIHLKRQYTGIWLAKFEANVATQDFYGAQAMLMRFDERQSILINGDINNFGQNRNMLDMATLVDEMPYPTQTKVARMEYSYEPDYAWRLRFNGNVQRTDEDKDAWTNTETYLTPQNLMLRDMQLSHADNTKINASTALRFRKKLYGSHELGYTFGYSRVRDKVDAKSLSYFRTDGNLWDDFEMQHADTITDGAGLLYTLFNPSCYRTTTFSHRADWHSAFTMGGSVLNLKARLGHNTTDTHRFENYSLTYFSGGESDRQRRFYDLHDYALNLNVNADYLFKYGDGTRHDGTVTPFICYAYDYGTASHPLYRLDRMKEWSDGHDWNMGSLGMLPEEEFRSLCIDEANSYYSLTGSHRGSIGGRLSHKLGMQNGAEWRFDASATAYYEKRTLDYTRDGVCYPLSRDGIFFAPSLSVKWENSKDTVHNWQPEFVVNYSGTPSMPELTYLLPIRDNEDPLNIFFGNSALKNLYTHKASMRYSMHQRHTGHDFYLQGSYSRMMNDVVLASVYDEVKGFRTYRPENTRRTHRADISSGYTLAIDRQRRFYLTASLSADYYCRANLTSLTAERNRSDQLLENYSVTPQLTLSFTVGKLNGRASWQTGFMSLRSDGTTTDYRTTQCLLEGSYSLPWGIGLHTYFGLHKNNGSSSHDLDRVQTCWNAALTKELLDGSFYISISAHDILNKAGTMRYNFTALSRTESYTNVTPRYLMVSLTSHLSWSKRNK